MLLSGFGLEESTVWSPANVAAQYEQRGVWCWHIPFFWLPHVPEMLISGKEEEFWTHFMKAECWKCVARSLALCVSDDSVLTALCETVLML